MPQRKRHPEEPPPGTPSSSQTLETPPPPEPDAMISRNTSIPVTPGDHLGNSNTYFEGPPETPDDLGGSVGVTSRRESIAKLQSLLRNGDPRTVLPDLQLTGGIISATVCIPYKLGFTPDQDWELRPRRGTSALFDSFSHLSSPDSRWNHTLLAWTGEIDQSPGFSSSSSAHGGHESAANWSQAAAPIPVNGSSLKSRKTGPIRISPADRARLEKQLQREQRAKVVPVWLSEEVDHQSDACVLRDQGRWRRYAERELYTLFHYKQNEPDDGRATRKAWADYFRMNSIYCERIVASYIPGDIIIIHDYALFLLPSMLRQKLPHAYIVFFLHIPFPSSEYYRCLSRRKEILEGVLGANLIGFQTHGYARHFASCCTRILGFESTSTGIDAFGARVAIDVFPIGIAASAVEQAAFESQTVESKVEEIKQRYAGMKIIIGRDRQDMTRGVVQKLEAFKVFLDKYPDWRNKVILFQISSPSDMNTEADGEQKFLSKVSDLAAEINGIYGSLSFAPVRHFAQYMAKEEYLGLLRMADVGLITSVRDGMNTTSMEYVVCQKDKQSPLILSEFSGTAASLGSAMLVNPWDLSGVADAIHRALTMSDTEKHRQHQALYRHVVENDVGNWNDYVLLRLFRVLESYKQNFNTPALNRTKLLLQYRAAKKRLFMFDYDGTLTPIVRDPQAAIPSDRVLRTLKSLASDPANQVWIISGRDQAFLDEWMGHISELGLSAEHGSFMRYPREDDWVDVTAGVDMSWQSHVMDTFQKYTEKTPGSFIERKKIALTWHYRRADPEHGALQAQKCKRELEVSVARRYDVEVMAGKANLEVRPRFVNKGEIAKRLVAEYGREGGQAPEFVLCLGDDFTDEDMFRALVQSTLQTDHVFAVTVGASSKQTMASYHVLEPADVISAISLLNGSTDAGNAGVIASVDGIVSDSRL